MGVGGEGDFQGERETETFKENCTGSLNIRYLTIANIP